MSPRRKLGWGLVLLASAAVVVGGLYGLAVYRVTHPEAEVASLFRVLELKPGTTVAEIGAGQGRMTVAMARLVGPTGRVFATEIDAKLVAEIQKSTEAAGLK